MSNATAAVLDLGTANTISACEFPVDPGHTAWMLVATAFVLLMTPGLAFFEAGLLRSRNSISILMQCWAGMVILSIMWYVVGYTLALGPDQGGVIGNFDFFFFNDVEYLCAHGDGFDIPGTVFATFQMMFAAITPLLITGAFSERVPFGSFVAFIVLWSLFIYYPVCHWVWGGGFLSTLWNDRGAVDFAGGIVIHTTAGVSSLMVAIILGPRIGFEPGLQLSIKDDDVENTKGGCCKIKYAKPEVVPKTEVEELQAENESKPHDIPLATIGAAMLWMGWFGFNAGSALTSGAGAGHTLLTTHIGACTCGMVWMCCSYYDSAAKDADGKIIPGSRKPALVESLNGVIAGLAGVTPASGFIHSQAGFCLGIVLGFASYYGVKLIKGKLKIDDALDVSSVHGITGIVGSIAIGFCASSEVNPGVLDGIFYGGDGTQLWYQLIAVGVCGAWAALWTLLICWVVEACMGGFRVSEDEERMGLDQSQHGESARVLDLSPVTGPKGEPLLSPGHGPRDATDTKIDDVKFKLESA